MAVFDRLILTGNSDRGHLNLVPLDSAPSGANSGGIYVSSDNNLHLHNGTGWVNAAESAIKGRANRGNTTVFFGDSIVKQSGATGALDFKDFANWAHLLSDGKIRLTYNAGVGGNSTQDMLDRIDDDVIAYAPARCLVLGGTNDFGDGIYATTTDRLTTIYETLQAAGIEPILATMTPRTDLDTDANLSLHTTNAWIRNYAATHGLVLFDAYAAVVDTDGDWISGYSDDALHPNEVGAKVLGQACSTALSPFYAPVDPLFGTLITDPASLLANGVFTGDTDANGVANSWSTSTFEATGTTSIVADSGIIGSWQQIEVTAATAGQNVQIYQNITTGWTAGDVVSFSGRVQTADMAGGATLSANISFLNGSSPNVLGLSDAPMGDVDGAFHLEQAIPTGTTTLRVRLIVADAPATLKVSQLAVRNLTTLGLD